MKNRLAIVVGLVLVLCTPAHADDQDELVNRLPELHVTEWIQGSADEVGHWGDGKVYLVELWGTWCLPCIKTIPHLTELQARYRERGLTIIGYSWEEDVDKVRKFVEEMGDKMRYVLVNDREQRFLGPLSEAGAVQGFPYAYLVDEAGEVAWRGGPKGLDEALEKFYSARTPQ
jgi:thiol-disulfide isomerase/thioredoxin